MKSKDGSSVDSPKPVFTSPRPGYTIYRHSYDNNARIRGASRKKQKPNDSDGREETAGRRTRRRTPLQLNLHTMYNARARARSCFPYGAPFYADDNTIFCNVVIMIKYCIVRNSCVGIHYNILRIRIHEASERGAKL